MEQPKYYLYNIKTKKINIIEEKKVIDKIYYQECRLPTKEELYIYNKKLDINDIRINISKIDEKIPLYDIYTENLYIIGKYNIYNRVIYQNYRFPDKLLQEELENNKEKLKDKQITNPITNRKINKLELMKEYLNNFDINILEETYIKVLYKYSNQIGKQITVCNRPSFTPQLTHIRPYYTRNEVINMALNLEKIEKIETKKNKNELEDEHITHEDLEELCKIVKSNEITSDMLILHQKYILDNNKLGLVQYYTMQGSSVINEYMRNMVSYKYANEYLEKIIRPMWELVLSAPKFDKDYIFYRFIHTDSYLKNLKIGEIFMENGFMSTTRDPFYRSDLYEFGFILMKIKIPKNTKGVALCLETISHFADEQEIIFPPRSRFRLVSRDDNCVYYSTDLSFASKIKRRYEFEWVENENVIFDRKVKKNNIMEIDFLKIKKTDSIVLNEQIEYFIKNYTNEMIQFISIIGDKKFTTTIEEYDSTSAYKKFYAMEIENGYSIYTFYEDYILFFIEIGTTKAGREMHVNYYTKYSAIDKQKILGDDNFVKYISSIAYYFNISIIVLYADYLNCNINIKNQSGGFIDMKKPLVSIQRGFSSDLELNKFKPEYDMEEKIYGGSYCIDIYNYLTKNIKRYDTINSINVELRPKFLYEDLDNLRKISIEKIIKKTDIDEIYQIYNKIYMHIDKNKNNIIDFYLWMKDNKCYLLDLYILKINRIFTNK